MPPSSFLQWLHQTYSQQWKGNVDITTVAAEDHAPKTPHWICTMVASGAVMMDKSGHHVTLDPITAQAEGRSKKEAEQAAAKSIHDTLVHQGWWDPAAPPPTSNKVAGVSRAVKFITDNIPGNANNPLAYLDISIDGQPVGRVVFELFRYKKGSTTELHAPLAVDNFLAMCRGDKAVDGRQLSYVGVPFTRLMRGFLLQAGDVVNKDGTGGAHIHTSYGENFPDEGLDDRSYRFSYPFRLACANLGVEHTNSSQFFITLAPTSQLDGRHTCFGKVMAGYGVIREIEALCSSTGRVLDEVPPVPVIIEAAGELPPGHLSEAPPVPPVSAGGWPLWPEDQGPPPPGQREAAFRMDIADHLKAHGNTAYTQGDALTALGCYQQALRYLSWSSFKVRSAKHDVDLEPEEQRALWDCESVLMGNIAAAQLKLKRFREAAQSCTQLLRRTPHSVKVLLRSAQAHIGLGPGEFSTASELLHKALAAAQQQQLPTRDVVAELHRLRSLQQNHSRRQKQAFAAAFASGLLHHPADDAPPSSAASLGPGVVTIPDAAAAAVGLRHIAAAPGRPPSGPVGPERVLQDNRPVVVDDAWGTHLLVADDDEDGGGGGGGRGSAGSDDEDDDDGDGAGRARGGGGGYNSYGAGLLRRLQKLGVLPGDDQEDDSWGWPGEHQQEDEEEGGEGEGEGEGGTAEGRRKWWRDEDDESSSSDTEQQQQQQQPRRAAAAGCPAGDAEQVSSTCSSNGLLLGSDSSAATAVNGSSAVSSSSSSSSSPSAPKHAPEQTKSRAKPTTAAAAAAAAAAAQGSESAECGEGEESDDGVPEADDVQEMAAAGVAASTAAGSSSDYPSYGDGALVAISQSISLVGSSSSSRVCKP